MGYWGIAYVLGPNLNSAGDNMGTANEIQRAVAQAIAFGKNSSSWEKAIIKSIQIRFPKDSSTANAEAYLESMKEAYLKFPENTFVTTLYVESIMNLHAWDFYSRM